ncbi:hypothetical protein B0T17DRAFT_363761 [Bombardia bombarda]|uniref:Uncharacterized protein n=1 Tax=Bombardia bombarda TaxID=252184 RepID=A0AA40BW86_9PEZI|nr:hypothetical protein B0T17DRAFT_363761 [Bombardia bombarda]
MACQLPERLPVGRLVPSTLNAMHGISLIFGGRCTRDNGGPRGTVLDKPRSKDLHLTCGPAHSLSAVAFLFFKVRSLHRDLGRGGISTGQGSILKIERHVLFVRLPGTVDVELCDRSRMASGRPSIAKTCGVEPRHCSWRAASADLSYLLRQAYPSSPQHVTSLELGVNSVSSNRKQNFNNMSSTSYYCEYFTTTVWSVRLKGAWHVAHPMLS